MRPLAPATLFLTLGLLLPAVLVLALLTGPVTVSPARLPAILAAALDANAEPDAAREWMILHAIRLPRVLLAMAVGAILAISGAVMQGLFRNPLADPSLIGVTSGASAGASCMIVVGALWLPAAGVLSFSLVTLGAFTGGLLASALVYRIATGPTGTSVSTMLLAGIAITALAGAFNQLFAFFADNEMLRRISLWQMGSLNRADWQRVGAAAVVAVALLLTLSRYGRALNAILLGESEARHLGIAVEPLKRGVILLVALGVGVAVTVSGTIAFVGLIVPHIVRLLIGPDHRALIPASTLAGAILLAGADAVGRVVVAPAELPAGIIMALLGAPFFVSLLLQQRRAAA